MIDSHFYYFLGFGLVCLVVLLCAARWASDSWLNPLVLSGSYIGLGSCYIGIVFLNGGALAIMASLGLVAYLAVFFGVWRLKFGAAVLRPATLPDFSVVGRFHIISTLVWIICSILVLLFVPQILKNGFSLSEISSFRYIVRSEAKFTFLIYMAVKGAILYPLVVSKTRIRLVLAGLIYLVVLVPIFLLGSKGALVALIFDGLTVYYLRSLFLHVNGGLFTAKRERSWVSKYVIYGAFFAGLVLVLGPVLIWSIGAAPDYLTAVNIAYNRALGSFDSVFFSVDAGLVPGAAGFSLPEWWFATPLKAVGHYSNSYNAVNQFIMMSYYSVGSEAAGMFPNNFQVMEAVLGLPIFASIPFLMMSGGLYAYFITWLCSQRYKSPIFALAFVMAVTNPYLMLLDGQSFWASLSIVFVFLGLLWAVVQFFGGQKIAPTASRRKNLGAVSPQAQRR